MYQIELTTLKLIHLKEYKIYNLIIIINKDKDLHKSHR
jgi:hypothetical protein